VVLGFIPTYIVCLILNAVGMLRVPREVELAGLDIAEEHARELLEQEMAAADAEARAAGLRTAR
ncbi:MAG TPA: ammonium transporter, partial [Alphaproteobacteria bacterium]|nr:ammonium transporter [Alphaproteobacteria bacterium]